MERIPAFLQGFKLKLTSFVRNGLSQQLRMGQYWAGIFKNLELCTRNAEHPLQPMKLQRAKRFPNYDTL